MLFHFTRHSSFTEEEGKKKPESGKINKNQFRKMLKMYFFFLYLK